MFENPLIMNLLPLIVLVLSTSFTFGQNNLENRASCEEYEPFAVFFQLTSENSLGSKDIMKNDLGDLNSYPELKELILDGKIFVIQQEFKQLALRNEEIARVYRAVIHQNVDIDELITKLERIPYIHYSEKIPVYKISIIPNDPDYTDPNKRWHLDQIDASNAWNINQGCANVKIAIVDDAILLNHEDLNSTIYVNLNEIPNNGIDDDNNGYIDDVNGFDVADNDNNPSPPATATASYFSHGTHVAGIAAGSTDNNLGLSSIGFNTSIIPIKTKSNSSTNPASLTNPMQGVEYAIMMNADVINMSWGSYANSYTNQLVFEYAESLGIICVGAVGNDALPFIAFPANYPTVLSVVATNQADDIANFSNYTGEGHIFAPGVNIWSSLASGPSAYGYLSGTSMSTPIVSGLIALMLCNNPQYEPYQIKYCLHYSSDFIPSTNIPGYSIPRINALSSLQCILPVQNSCDASGCELIKNGTFETPGDANITDYDQIGGIFWGEVCAWEDYCGSVDCLPRNTASGQNHYAHLQARFINPIDPISQYESLITADPLNLTPGQTYKLEFDYSLTKSSTNNPTTDHLDSIAVKLVKNNWVEVPAVPNITDESILIHSIENVPVDTIYPGWVAWSQNGFLAPQYFHHVSVTFVAPNDLSIQKLVIHPVSDYPFFEASGLMGLCIDNVSVTPSFPILAVASTYTPSPNDCVTLSAITTASGGVMWEPSYLFADPTTSQQSFCLDTMNLNTCGALLFTVTAFDTLTSCTTTDTVELFVQGADTLAPVPDEIHLPNYSGCNYINSITPPTATDNCLGTISGTPNVTFPITQDTTIIWTYTDNAGNIYTQTQTIIISPLDISTSLLYPTISANQVGVDYQWIYCITGNPIAGAVYQDFIPAVQGEYAVILSSGPNCIDTSACVMVSNVGFDENGLENELKIYPNPTSGELVVQYSLNDIIEIKIITMAGKEVYTCTNIDFPSTTLNLSLLAKGVYMVHIRTTQKEYNKRIIIN